MLVVKAVLGLPRSQKMSRRRINLDTQIFSFQNRGRCCSTYVLQDQDQETPTSWDGPADASPISSPSFNLMLLRLHLAATLSLPPSLSTGML